MMATLVTYEITTGGLLKPKTASFTVTPKKNDRTFESLLQNAGVTPTGARDGNSFAIDLKHGQKVQNGNGRFNVYIGPPKRALPGPENILVKIEMVKTVGKIEGRIEEAVNIVARLLGDAASKADPMFPSFPATDVKASWLLLKSTWGPRVGL